MAVSARSRGLVAVVVGACLAISLLGVRAPSAGAEVEHFVIGGAVVTDLDRWPSMVSLHDDDGHFCGGTVLTPTWVLTAVHCFWSEGDTPDALDEDLVARTVVREGSLSSSSGGTNHQVVDVVHRATTGAQDFLGGDIALVQVATPMSSPPVSLPSADAQAYTFTYPPTTGVTAPDGSLWVTGWGGTEDDDVSERLREASLAFWSDNACGNEAPGQEICAGVIDPPTDACAGDSGGPLWRIVDGRRWQIGIVSRGDDCPDIQDPGLYTWTPAWFTEIVEVTGYTLPSRPGDPIDPTGPGTPGGACPQDAVPPAGLQDTAGNAHERAIDCVVWYGLAQGTSTTAYSPRNTVNRAQMASFIARFIQVAGATLPNGQGQFTDIAGNTHAGNIERLSAAGIVQGVGDGRYAPANAVNRAQMASFLARAFEFIEGQPLPVTPSPFTDVAGNAHESNIHRVAGAGFALGTTATTYSPGNTVRRDQMASFLTRMLDTFTVNGRVTRPV